MPYKMKVKIEIEAELLINKFAAPVLRIPEQNIDVSMDMSAVKPPKVWSDEEATYCLESTPFMVATCGEVRDLIEHLTGERPDVVT